jgi:hypothetical protein
LLQFWFHWIIAHPQLKSSAQRTAWFSNLVLRFLIFSILTPVGHVHAVGKLGARLAPGSLSGFLCRSGGHSRRSAGSALVASIGKSDTLLRLDVSDRGKAISSGVFVRVLASYLALVF